MGNHIGPRPHVCIGCGRRDTNHPSRICSRCNSNRACEDRSNDDAKSEDEDLHDIICWRDERANERGEPTTE